LDLIIPFITGVTTGGLSCLAVQGGLLASSLSQQVEEDLKEQTNQQNSIHKFRPRIAQPIALFLTSKWVAYTLLGFLLGAAGSALQLTPVMRAVLTIAIGIFMLGNGLRMLKVHPIFRYFVIEPPSFITRAIRRTSKKNTSVFASFFLGAMTVFIPCGVTQAMMAVALGTGSPLQGAAIMASFTLGTTPVFFSLAYFATRLGAVMEKYFTRIVAAIVIILALVSINSGLNLMGSPYTFTNLANELSAHFSNPDLVSPTGNGTPAFAFSINVNNNGYSPTVLHLASGRQVKLIWVTNNVSSCALSIVIPRLNYEKLLPQSGVVTFEIPPQPQGTVIRYSCSMGMYTGQLVFDLD
jgi:uncharacterized protein